MIVAGLAANTAAALLQRLQGKPHDAGHQAGAVERFGAKLDALLPGAGAAGQAIGTLGSVGQGLLDKLGLGADATSQTTGPAQATRAYAAAAGVR